MKSRSSRAGLWPCRNPTLYPRRHCLPALIHLLHSGRASSPEQTLDTCIHGLEVLLIPTFHVSCSAGETSHRSVRLLDREAIALGATAGYHPVLVLTMFVFGMDGLEPAAGVKCTHDSAYSLAIVSERDLQR
jgi:hypothetical protein